MCQEVLCHAVSAENLTARVLQFLKSSIGAKHGTAMAETAPSCVGLTLQCAEHCGVALQLTRTLQRSSQIYLHPPPPSPSQASCCYLWCCVLHHSKATTDCTTPAGYRICSGAWPGGGREGRGKRSECTAASAGLSVYDMLNAATSYNTAHLLLQVRSSSLSWLWFQAWQLAVSPETL